MTNIRDKKKWILKAARENQLVTHKGAPTRVSADFSKDTLHTRRNCYKIFEVMKSKNPQPRLLYPTRLSLRVESQSFPKKKKLEFFTTTLVL